MPVLLFSLLRLALFAVSFVVLWAVGMHSWLAPVVAAFLAWGFSYVLLSGPRDSAARYLADRSQRARRTDDDAAVEDAADDAARHESA
ncbi:DUF4229 domain-containing protein [Cellulomonas sp. URHD0024]|uniref:DUF4229 domain-containing protein n=1 Tax=Cellulomonas sp. URHD0024 TaxID=1302620 RepID=UPI000488E972|nr:DUF4229 domain-containing protein [Cellulomonas sp. URHD0024]